MNLERTPSTLEMIDEPTNVRKESPTVSMVDLDLSYSAPNSQVSMFSFEEPRCGSPPHVGQQLPPSGQPGNYDPNRIPASVFGTKPANHSEWSMTSNESLFSIHMGNNSFSRDHVFMLYKSGDLQEMSNCFPPPLKPMVEVESMKINGEDTTNVSTESAQKTANMTEEPEKHVHQENSATAEEARRSSFSSTHSFQFPIMNNEEERRNSSVKQGKQQQKQVSIKQELRQQDPEESKPQEITKTSKPLKGLKNNWLSCFSRCPFGC